MLTEELRRPEPRGRINNHYIDFDSMKKFHFLVLVMILALSGCSRQAEEQKSSGTVAAVVNGIEITRRQVDYHYNLSAKPGMSDAESENLKRRILATLIQEELLAEKARSMKLDQSKDYALERYSCEKKSLAALAKNEITRKKSAVSPEQVDNFVRNNPEYFSRRTLYNYDVLLISGAEKPFLESLDAMIEKGADIEQCIEQLKAKNISFVRKLEMQPSEKIPASMRKIMAGLKRDVPQVVIVNDKLSLILVLHQTSPVPLEGIAARTAASTMLTGYLKRQLLGKEMKDLVDNAKITYYDEYLKTQAESKTLTKLPVPDRGRVNKIFIRKGLFGTMFFFSFVLAVVVLTAGMRTLYDRSWLPRLWKKKKEPVKTEKGKGAYSVGYSPPTYRVVYVSVLLLLIAGVLVADVRFLWSSFAIWVLFACMLFGSLGGIVASRLFQAKTFGGWRRKKYLVAATVLTVPVLVGTLLLMYFSVV